ncbi:MAG: hypothetical protein LBU28_00365 [Spirochaetaceae bacterium]|nr:hypothetical protein [Spirochaetaceae bacterium]
MGDRPVLPGKGPVKANGSWDAARSDVIALHNVKLHIESGTLTIPNGKSLRLTNDGGVANLRSLTGEDGAHITIESGGYLYLEQNAVGANFYTSMGDPVSYTITGPFNTVPSGTYDWTDDADGDGNPGRQKDS